MTEPVTVENMKVIRGVTLRSLKSLREGQCGSFSRHLGPIDPRTSQEAEHKSLGLLVQLCAQQDTFV